MASVTTAKKILHKNKKNRGNKTHLVFDENKRREFLTGFRKRKLQRKKDAKEKLERDLKEERRRLKSEAQESYKKLVVSHRSIPELDTFLKEEYEDEDATIKVEELSIDDIYKKNNFIGSNQIISIESKEKQIEDEKGEEQEEIPGMELKNRKICKQKVTEQTFDSKKDVKKVLKKEATQKVKKSKVFQLKNKIENQKQRKKSLQLKKQRLKIREKSKKKR